MADTGDSGQLGLEQLEEQVPQEQSEAFDRVWASSPGVLGFLREVNNIPIASRYMTTAFTLFLVAGVLGLLMRTQLAVPDNDVVDAETYNQIFTMHGTTMMFLFVIPFIEAIANYFLPLLIGTRDLPFPRLTAFSYWTYLFGAIYIFASFLFGVAPNAGWTAYPPLTLKEHSPGINLDFWDIGLSVAEIAAMGAAAEIIVAILRMRAPGMALHRMPIFAWAMLITAFMIIFAFTPLIVGTAMLEFDRKGFTHFFDPNVGGEPLLWQHLFWVFGHPEVYIMFLPAAGIISHVVQVFSRRPLVGYTLVVLSLIATGFISFGLWVHHMFTTGISPVAMGFFAAASMLIAIPNGIQFFAWVATLWTGRPLWRTPLLFVIGFLITFLIGGLTGVMVGAVPFDLQVHDSYFVVAHFHYVLIGGVLFPLFAGIYYWLPKVTGRLLSERMGRWNFWLMFVFFNIAFFPMHISGLLGMPRRVYTFAPGLGLEPYNLLSTIGAYGFAAGVLVGVANIIWSFRNGAEAGHDPWQADTLEWSHSSPPPQAQFKHIPEIRSRHPMWHQETLAPQDGALQRLLRPLQSAPTSWRGALVVSVMDARPVGIVHVPSSTIWPFVVAVAFLFLFAGALVDNLWILGSGALVALVGAAGWFAPKPSERRALDEISVVAGEDSLPLAVYGPRSNGWWGTWVFITVWVTALATLIASYFYLSQGPSRALPARLPSLEMPAIATVLLLATIPVTYLYARRIDQRTLLIRRASLAAAFLLNVAFIAITFKAVQDSGITGQNAYGSAFIFLHAFQWLTALIMLVFLGVSQAWAWLRPDDPRGWGTTLNSTLFGYFAAFSWTVVFATVYLGERLW
jgi:cytochrome c oxidase subunit I+III